MEGSEDGRPQGLPVLCGVGIAIGLVGGVGAWVFRMLIAFFHNLFFFGTLSVSYDANLHTAPSLWGPGVILVPVIGAVLVAWIVQTFAPEAKGHGVPEVIDAIYYRDGRIRPMVVVAKSLASGLSIGTGGSVGREGPIIQIGSTFGSMVGVWMKLPVRQVVTLIAAGAGAGIAATFNAPLGGLAFAVELLLVAVNAQTLLPVALATVTATWVGRNLIGISPAFDIPALTLPATHVAAPFELIAMAPLGVIVGLASVLFIKALYWSEDRFDALPLPYVVRHALGMLPLGVLIWLLMEKAGHYYVQGVGYATIQDILAGTLADPGFLLLLFALKLLATCLTLGSGASGGVFSPSLFMGAALGAAFGHLCLWVAPGLQTGLPAFAIAGMAAAIGGTTGAVLTATVMLFEMTRDYHALLPVVIAVATAYATRKALMRESIYTMKLVRRGHVVPEGLQAGLDGARRAQDVASRRFRVAAAGDTLSAAAMVTVVAGPDGRIAGVAPPLPHGPLPPETWGALVTGRFVVVPPDQPVPETLRAMRAAGAEAALVSTAPGGPWASAVTGVIAEPEIMATAQSFARWL